MRRGIETETLDFPKMLVLASGSGTNFENIAKRIKDKTINLHIAALITNNPNAGCLDRAENLGIHYIVHNYPDRADVEQEILFEVEKHNPQLIVLAGWMKILSPKFIAEVNKRGTIIINLHPAIITGQGKPVVETSQGLIPELRGTHAIENAYNLNLPVSGVTVHEVVPGPFDTGRVIMQKEVLRDPNDTLETWEAKIHAAEYEILPQAINLILNE